jgi:propanol-preferring alcohol dehydrogenase
VSQIHRQCHATVGTQVPGITNPYECEVTNTYWGTIEELHEVVAMYRQGQIVPEIERFSLENGLEAYRRLQAGELSGRAVVVPHGS